LTKQPILHFLSICKSGKYYKTTKTKQNHSSAVTVSSTHAGASSEHWYLRYLWTLQGPGPTKPTSFLGHWSPGHRRVSMALGRTSPALFTSIASDVHAIYTLDGGLPNSGVFMISTV